MSPTPFLIGGKRGSFNSGGPSLGDHHKLWFTPRVRSIDPPLGRLILNARSELAATHSNEGICEFLIEKKQVFCHPPIAILEASSREQL
jgi:hypothetical protein